MNDPPLLRARCLRFGAYDHVLLLVLDDIAIDGWSMLVFLEALPDLMPFLRSAGSR
jgi:hypothetical protein